MTKKAMGVPEATGAYLRPLLGVPFTDTQLEVVTHRMTPQLVVAGAGSGKTMVMAARVVHLVAVHGVPPGEVLGLTFTNKAAGELAERVRRALRALSDAGVRDDSADELPTVSTYHAYAAGIVREHGLRIGREPDARLLTEAPRWQLAVQVVRAARGPFEWDWRLPHVARLVLALDGELSEHLVEPDAVRALDAELVESVRLSGQSVQAVREIARTARIRDQLLDLVDEFRRRKTTGDWIDYGDQVALAATLAEGHPEVAAGERARYRVVLLDEYQDTGVAQRRLLAALYGNGHPVTAVGDPNQAIYGWRGASLGNLLRFPEHFPVARHERTSPQFLLTSFRSGGRLVDAANAMSEPLRASGAALLDVPPLAAEIDRVAAGEVHTALLMTADDEATWLAGELARAVHDEGIAPGAVAVLCRRRADFARLHAALVGEGLPVEVVGLGGLLDMPVVADVVATLRVVADPTANVALLRLLTGPRWRIGVRDLATLGDRAKFLAQQPSGVAVDAADALTRAASGVDPCDVVALTDALDRLGNPERYSPGGYARLLQLADELRGLRAILRQPLVDAVATVVATIGIDVEVEAAPAAVAAAHAANLAAFLDHAAQFAGLDGESDLVGFLAFLDAAADADNGLDAGAVSGADTVKLLTVHKAKGLEWDVVAVPGLVKDVFPSGQGRPRWTKRAEVLPFGLRGDREDLPADPELSGPGVKAFEKASAELALDEERRLAYVAITRARHRLLASGFRWGATQVNAKEPSPFLLELRDRADVVAEWVDEPGEENPQRGVHDVAWPAAYDGPALTIRRAAAALVEDAMSRQAHPTDEGLTATEYAQVQGWRAEAALLLAEARRAGAERPVPMPAQLTTSQVVALAADAEGFARSLSRPMPRRPLPAARRGRRFHSWVESLFGDRPLLDPDDLPGAMDAALDDAELTSLQESFLGSHFAQYRPVAMETPFELSLGGWRVRGRIDAVYQTGYGYDVVDYKTGREPDDPQAAALQLAIYRVAWAELTDTPLDAVTAGFLYVRDGELRRPEHLPDRAELTALLESGTQPGAVA